MKKLFILIGLLITIIAQSQTVVYPGTRIFTGTLQIDNGAQLNFKGNSIVSVQTGDTIATIEGSRLIFLNKNDTTKLHNQIITKLGLHATADNSNLLQGRDSTYIKGHWGGAKKDSSWNSIRISNSGETLNITPEIIYKNQNGFAASYYYNNDETHYIATINFASGKIGANNCYSLIDTSRFFVASDFNSTNPDNRFQINNDGTPHIYSAGTEVLSTDQYGTISITNGVLTHTDYSNAGISSVDVGTSLQAFPEKLELNNSSDTFRVTEQHNIYTTGNLKVKGNIYKSNTDTFATQAYARAHGSSGEGLLNDNVTFNPNQGILFNRIFTGYNDFIIDSNYIIKIDSSFLPINGSSATINFKGDSIHHLSLPFFKKLNPDDISFDSTKQNKYLFTRYFNQIYWAILEQTSLASLTNSAPTASNLSITGTVSEGQILTGHYTYNDVNGDLEGTSTFRWLRSDDNVFANAVAITGATAITYTLTSNDIGKYIFFEVTPVALTGSSPGIAYHSAATSSIQASIQDLDFQNLVGITKSGTVFTKTVNWPDNMGLSNQYRHAGEDVIVQMDVSGLASSEYSGIICFNENNENVTFTNIHNKWGMFCVGKAIYSVENGTGSSSPRLTPSNQPQLVRIRVTSNTAYLEYYDGTNWNAVYTFSSAISSNLYIGLSFYNDLHCTDPKQLNIH